VWGDSDRLGRVKFGENFAALVWQIGNSVHVKILSTLQTLSAAAIDFYLGRDLTWKR